MREDNCCEREWIGESILPKSWFIAEKILYTQREVYDFFLMHWAIDYSCLRVLIFIRQQTDL